MPETAIPNPGLGTMRITDPETGPEAIKRAIEIGYRHLDTAQKYENEHLVGAGISRSEVPREDLFVATKIEEMNLAHDDVLRTANASLERLGLEYVDLLYIHFPSVSSEDDRYDPEDTIPAFNRLLDEGKTRHVGVANFTPELFAEAQRHFDAPILAHQVEMHPLLQQEELVAHAREHDVHLIAYCPMIRGEITEVPEIRDIAEKYGVSTGEVSMAWLLSKDGVIPIPKSAGEHLEENFRAQDLVLDDEDLARIDAIDREHRVVDSGKCPWNW